MKSGNDCLLDFAYTAAGTVAGAASLPDKQETLLADMLLYETERYMRLKQKRPLFSRSQLNFEWQHDGDTFNMMELIIQGKLRTLKCTDCRIKYIGVIAVDITGHPYAGQSVINAIRSTKDVKSVYVIIMPEHGRPEVVCLPVRYVEAIIWKSDKTGISAEKPVHALDDHGYFEYLLSTAPKESPLDRARRELAGIYGQEKADKFLFRMCKSLISLQESEGKPCS